MMKIRALNRESSSDEDVPVIRREAQEEIALELYNKALRLQTKGKLNESKQILSDLIHENIPDLENNGGLPKSMSTLKYSCYVNLGNIHLKLDEIGAALDHFLNASELDSTDVTLWHKIGNLSLKENKFRQAAYAFSKGTECSESHWPCLDKVISVLYAIKDTVACLVFIGKALMLDNDYTKGLVLRKQIYLDNPATKEYYQLLNPDYIWEPSLDVEIDKEDEKEILAEIKILCDKVIEVEKSFEPRPLQTIPLPKVLDNYTWLAFGKTVTYIHQYITDNEMSHFTFLDMSKCMSQKIDTTEAEPIPTNQKVDEAEEVLILNDVEEKMDTEPIQERRFSQTSDNTNNDIQENTPVQTDNDEEQMNDQDTEDQEENGEQKNEKNRRGSKRKRDVLSELQIWGWHSKRKPPKKVTKDFTVEDALNRIIPKHLLKNKISNDYFNQVDDTMNTMDIYKMYVDERELNFLSPIHSPKSSDPENYFGTDIEKENVQNVWSKKRKYVDAIVLIKEFVFEVSKLSHYRWPKELVNLYISAYKMYREHCDIPQIHSEDTTFEQIRNDAIATLLYGELVTFSSESREEFHPAYLNYLQNISGWKENWKNEYKSFFIRTFWLRSHLFRKDDLNDLAATSLQLILEVIEEEEEINNESFVLNLPNCLKCSIITRQMIERILNHLKIINSLGEIEIMYNQERYTEVAEIIKKTFESGSKPKVGKMGRPAQLAMLMHSLWFTNMTECFIWTEECLFEALENYKKYSKDFDKWEKIVEKCLAIFYEIIKTETITVVDALPEDKRIRLIESLCKIVCKQLNTESPVLPFETVTPWILLHYILTRDEQRQYAQKRASLSKKDRSIDQSDIEDEVPASVAILFSAHEFLGPKSWCLTNKGELLHFILDNILDRLDTPVFEGLRDKIDIHLEQCLFCLYQYPSKKNKISRHLVDHNVDPLSLTWERSFQLYQYYGPDCLPEYNSYKNASISVDLEQLLKRIIALVPGSYELPKQLPKIMDYIQGKVETLPEPMEFPNRMRAIYYLIGDYYFKQREFGRCLKYFQQDLSINPYRLDSWACLGLSYAAQLDTKLNHCEKLDNEMEFLDKAKSAQICFRKALELAPDHLALWIECGSFEYTVHSFCSRLLKFESENFSMEKFEFLENQKNSYLDSSGNSLEQAISLYDMEDTNEQDERWLQYYLLGKIAEKKQKEPSEYLQYYMTANTLLEENEAAYPDKINYNNPQHLAVEVLELHYRINASVLKYIELHEGKDIPNTMGAFFKKCLASSKFLNLLSQKNVVISQNTEVKNNTEQSENVLNVEKGKDKEISKEKEEEIKNEVKKCLDEIVEKIHKEMESDVIIVEDKAGQEVILISDSDEENADKKSAANNKVAEVPECKVEDTEEKIIQEMSKNESIQDVLDRMMEETMKETEKDIKNMMELDSSGTEQVEEVIVKEPSKQNGIKPKAVKKVKPSDGSGTDTDNPRTSIEEDSCSSSSSSTSSSSSSDSDSDDDNSSSSSSSSENSNENMTHGEVSQLIEKCVQGLEICITRLPQNYKALYRLAHLFFYYKTKKDIAKSKQLLLNEYKCKDGTVVTGLFSERNAKNFFNGIWRIPSTEIDRPGSLSAHMSRCIALLLQLLRSTNENRTLMELCMQLKRVPDADKVYIKDSERLAFSEQALSMCVQSIKTQTKNIPNMNNTQIIKLLQDIYRLYVRVQKHYTAKESIFSNLLIDAYKTFKKDKADLENVNLLDCAIKFCQHNRPVEKRKVVQNTTPNPNPVAMRGPGVAAPPVLPFTSTPNQAPKPPRISGRPRGRPPLPKMPGQPKRSRNVMGSNPYTSAWQKSLLDQSLAYGYLKHYQEELIKQYSQNLSIGQMAQLGQLMAQGQINNPITAATITNQMLSQTGFLNPGGLPKQSTVVSGMPTLTSSSTMNKLSENVSQNIKKMQEQTGTSSSKIPSFTPEQLKYFNTMLATMSAPISSKTSNKPQISQPKQKLPVSTHQTAISNTISSFSKPISTVSSSKTSTSSLKSNSNPTKFSTADILKLNPVIPPKPTVPQPIFKEPTKAHQASTVTTSISSISNPPDKSSVLLKDRPNISITAVTLTNTSPVTASSNFGRPVNTSPGKTLQEKLADKKKELQSKHKADIFPTVDPSPPPILKNLNIPSSLTVSPAHVPQNFPISPLPLPPKSKYSLDVQSVSTPVASTLSAKPLTFPQDLGTLGNVYQGPKYPPEAHKLVQGQSVNLATQQRSSKHQKLSKTANPGKFLNIPKSSGIAIDISPVRKNEVKSSITTTPKKSSDVIAKRKIEFSRAPNNIEKSRNKDIVPSLSIIKTGKSKDSEKKKSGSDDVILID